MSIFSSFASNNKRAPSDFQIELFDPYHGEADQDEFSDISRSSGNFAKTIDAKIRFSKRNSLLIERFKIPEQKSESPRLSMFSDSKIDMIVKDQIGRKRGKKRYTSMSSISTRKSILETGSCIMWYFINEKLLQDLIPDFEMFQCKKMFEEILKKVPSCHEANFGYGRLLYYERDIDGALNYIKNALKFKPKDYLYRIWFAFLQLKMSWKTRGDFITCKSLLEALRIENPNSLEILWGLMELSMSGLLRVQSEIELPEYYASHIKENDNYYGYLAWGVLFLQKNPEKGILLFKEMLKRFPNRPEAYIVLWQHFHKNKNYVLSEDVAAEAFLKATEGENSQFYILLCIIYAKAYFKRSKIHSCLELLEQKFIERPTCSVLIYHYGKYATKSRNLNYRGAAISALAESLEHSSKNNYGNIHYWLSKAYILNNQPFEAYLSMKKALKYLKNTDENKIQEIKKKIEEIKPKIDIIEHIDSKTTTKFGNKLEIEKHKIQCEQLKNFQKGYSDIYLAKISWACGNEDDAITLTEEAIKSKTLNFKAYEQLFHYLGHSHDQASIKKHAKEMIKKAKNPSLPTPLWVQAHIKYAKLIENSNPAKAIIILKCLAKVFPPLSHGEIPYIKAIKKAVTLSELKEVTMKIVENSSSYNYSNYKNSQVDLQYYMKAYIPGRPQETDITIETYSTNDETKKFDLAKEIRHFSTNRSLTGKSERYTSLTIETEFEDSETKSKDKNAIPVETPKKGSALVFPICSNPHFLYKIAKIAVLKRVCIADGLYAIEDFLSILKHKKQKKHTEALKIKGLYWKSFLLEESFERVKALDLMRSILPGLIKYKFSEKAEKIKTFLSNH
ncbi:unnamed protein product [Blepharisma stoltei]|uniref:Tetratricopeptide repeat protein n=1 Tax=Blepharisma stoltei TaxID=1481888 RepID=A0AAU9J3F8_9CILI|nr:unnamed protein product [Blepharisma stoltei]